MLLAFAILIALAAFPAIRAGCGWFLAGAIFLYVMASLFGAVGVLIAFGLVLVAAWRPAQHR